MLKQPIIAAALLAGIAALAQPTAAGAAVKIPSCGELVGLGQEPDLRKLAPLNQVQGRFALPAPYVGPRAEELFGQPTLAWTQQDLAAVIKATGDCAAAAKKARKVPDAQALAAVWQSLGGVRSTLGGVAVTEQRLDQRLEGFLGIEPSRPTLVSLMAVASVRDGTAASMAKAAQALKDHSVQINAWHPVHSQAQYTLDLLRDTPEKSWAKVFPPIDKRIVEVRQWVIDDAKAAINATPETPEGLRAMAPALARTKAELSRWLPEAEIATLDKIAGLRRDAVEDGLVAKEAARIAALPPNADGLNQLRMVQASPVRAALSARRVAALDAKVVARRDEIGKVVTDEQIKQLDQYPSSLPGLRDIDAFKTNTARGLEALAGPEAARRFQEAAVKRMNKVGEESFPAFRKALGEVQGNEEGLAGFDEAVAEVRGPIGVLDAGMRTRYQDAIQKRRVELVAAVEKENARLVKLPLQGAVYADPRGGAKIEFRNKTRVYITMFGDMTVEGEYEVDGDRVIIRTPRSNDVFKREGAWLRNAMLNLRRMPEK
jgi:hypothetical protein